MSWFWGIALILSAARWYAYRSHKRQVRRLMALFDPLSSKHRGEIEPGGLLTLPQLRFVTARGRVLVTVMAASDEGPFTVLELTLPFDARCKLRVQRSDTSLRRQIDRLLDTIKPSGCLQTGDDAFDRAFRIGAGDRTSIARLLDGELRAQLLGATLPQLDVRVDGHKVTILMDGELRSPAQLEAMLDIATGLSERCRSIP